MRRTRILWFLAPLAIAAGLAAWLISGAAPPGRIDRVERTVAARTMIARAQAVRPLIRGYGTVRPGRSWQAVTEVSGEVIFRHPDLETGRIVPAGTRVLEIDPTRYKIALRQAEADLAALRAELDQVEVDAGNTRGILEIERERLALAEDELERVRELAERGTAPQSRLDEQRRATLQLRRGVQELENVLSLVPVRKAGLDARIARAKAGMSQAERDLGRTRIETPFDIRVGQVHVEKHQFVPSGAPLVTGDGIDRAEVTAQLPLDGFPRVMGAAVGDADLDMGSQPDVLGRIEARLRLVSDPAQGWDGQVLRIENALDAQARSVPVVVSVDAPYQNAHPPLRLPLVPNMYVEVVLTGPPGPPRIVLPASAVHGGDTVYLRDATGRLELREVTLGWRQLGQAVIASGLDPGEEVILDDIVPALPGLPVTPAEDLP